MNRVTKVTAAFFVLGALAFALQSFGNIAAGNIFFLVFNVSASFYMGRKAFGQIRELRLGV